MYKKTQLAATGVLLILAIASSAATADMAEREQAARLASQAFLQELGGALKQQVEKGGPASAVPVCSEIAPGIASKLSREHGWQVKRVGKEPNGRYFRFAKAIGVQPQCVGCHGAKDQLAPQVADTLARDYPHDQATGYKPGDLRGAVSIKQPLR